jgi:ABC-type multidrug transport system ATPase subunit
MLRALAGRMRATSGTVKLRGMSVIERRREVRREIAALIDPPTLYPDLTLRENLALIEAAWSGEGRGSGIVSGLGTDALSVFGLTHLADRFGHELSSGQRQLTSLAVTFARPAGVLLLDEPEQRLDPDRRLLVGETMLAARSRGMAVVFASHDAELVARVADRSVRVGE